MIRLLFSTLVFFFLFSCSRREAMKGVDVRVNKEEVFLILREDTISSFVNVLGASSVNTRLFEIFPKEDTSDVDANWSCDLFQPKEQRSVFDFSEVEQALNDVFERCGLQVGDEQVATRFILENIFTGFRRVADITTDASRTDCEEKYRDLLQFVLSLDSATRNASRSGMYIQGLDSCQIVQTLEASKRVMTNREGYTFLTLQECPTDLSIHNLSNKPYFAISYEGVSPLKVRLELLNDLAYFGWVGI